MLAMTFRFHGESLAAALSTTFGRRGTELPVGPPTALSSEFTADAQKQAQWTAFLGRMGLT